MIPIARLREPRILAEKKATWAAAFTASGKRRPDSNKYAHPEVVQTLRSMSHDKCFYCETRESRLTVDHYVEVSERADLAFEWANLYLACDGCQKKEPNTSVPVAGCLDPCAADVVPADHLSFADERAKPRSPRGEQTVRKYRLNREARLLERCRQLRLWGQVLDRIREMQIADGRSSMTTGELAELRRFADADEPFSLMFSCLLKERGLL